ncbi:MAG TPA: hypothetical protein VFB65_20160 [Pyrinomonadaceae bacterium]|nr:hypothetical protein [Pyrinomonadaceae bacterium]
MLLRKLLVVVFVISFSATAASAYTIVMRNGRRVEIPNTFTVTKSTLTYETAPGIQVTIQLTSIDVATTERINGQPAGSFFATASAPKAVAQPVQTRQTPARRSITNQDLEVYRRARVANERERQELGLPSAEDRRREVEEIDNRTQEQLREMRSREELEFWRNRAMSLENQLITTTRTNVPPAYDMPWAYPYGVGLVTTGYPFGFDGFDRFDRFDRFGFNNFGFNNFGFKSHFPGFRGRLRFTTPKSIPNAGFRGGFRGGAGGGGGMRGGGSRGRR